MLGEAFLGIDLAVWQWAGGIAVAVVSAVSGAAWKIVVWCAGRIDGFLDRQDKFMAKLEANDAKRIDILGQISTDNALKAAAISSLTNDLREVKEDVAVLKDRLPGSRISLPGIAPGDRA